MITTRDYQLALGIGMCTGILLLPIIFVLDIVFPYRVLVTLGVSIAAMPLGIWLGGQLEDFFGFGMLRFSKYFAAGLLSFAIDFATLNIISHFTGITTGLTVGWINFPGFFLATINAYFWNRLWVFQKKEAASLFGDLPKFLLVIIIGIIINSTVLVLISSTIAPPFGLTERRWLNIAKICATMVAIVWNFFGYKFIVFKE